jgi:hypothetical protein
MGLVAEVIEVELVHEPLHCELDFGPLTAGDDAIAHAHELEAAEPEPVVEAQSSAMSRVSRERSWTMITSNDRAGAWAAARRFLISRAVLDPEPGQRRVLKRRDDRPALPLSMGAAELQLVLDRGRRLQVGAKSDPVSLDTVWTTMTEAKEGGHEGQNA